MSEPARTPRMTADEFIAWSMEQPKGQRYELVDGEVVGMASERALHARTKGRIYRRLAEAVEQAGLPCTVFPDGMAVEVDADTVYEPDAMVHCGEPVPDDTVLLKHPVIIVEVLSPSTQAVDTGEKLADYFRLPSVRHYLVVRTRNRVVIHHARAADGTIATRIVREGEITLDPPGIVLRDFWG